MSVYIKGMKMPKNCHLCPMCLMRFCQAGDRELSERETRPNAKRPEDCPLLPVPPHGRLIDADKLCLSSGFSTATEYGRGRSDQIEAIKSNAPTIIPANQAEEGET